MEFMSVRDAALHWNISERRVQSSARMVASRVSCVLGAPG